MSSAIKEELFQSLMIYERGTITAKNHDMHFVLGAIEYAAIGVFFKTAHKIVFTQESLLQTCHIYDQIKTVVKQSITCLGQYVSQGEYCSLRLLPLRCFLFLLRNYTCLCNYHAMFLTF